MKKTLLILPIVIIVVFVTLINNHTVSPYAFAKDKHHPDFTNRNPFSGISYDAMYKSNQYVDSFTPLPLSSKMADILTASFTNIIDTQINTGIKTN